MPVPAMLAGLRVIEIADERAEYTGLLLAGLGAEVVKIEPPEGNATRRIGPFLEDRPGPERSLFFWNYNRNKKSVVLDLREPAACEDLLRLLGGRRCPAGCELRRAERGVGARPRRTRRAVSAAGDGADDAVRRRRAVGRFQGLGPDPSGARRRHDELRLRPGPEPRIRHAADRTADLARLSHRRRAIGDRDHRRADPPAPQRPGAGRLGRRARGGVEEPRAGHHVLGDAAGAVVAADQPSRRRDPEPLARHLPYQGRALVHHPRHGRARPEEPGAAIVQIRRAGRSAAAAAGCRSAGASGARHGRQRRGAGAHARHRPALCARLDLRRHAVARGAGCRPPVGAAAQAARERARRALADRARPLPMSITPSTAAASAIRPASGSAARRAGRSDAGRRCWAKTRNRFWASPFAGPVCRPRPASSPTRGSRRCTTSRSRCRG